jgi:hypothetical protein
MSILGDVPFFLLLLLLLLLHLTLGETPSQEGAVLTY